MWSEADDHLEHHLISDGELSVSDVDDCPPLQSLLFLIIIICVCYYLERPTGEDEARGISNFF